MNSEGSTVNGLVGRRSTGSLCVRMAGLVVAVLVLLSGPAAGQARGVVVDSATGAPLRGAVIEAWSPMHRTGAAQTGVSGRFGLTAADTSGAMVLFVRAVGFQPLRLRIRGRTIPDTIRLARAPVWLPALGTSRGGRLCPVIDDPGARALLAAVARHYDSTRNLGPTEATAHFRDGFASDSEVGEWSADPSSNGGVAGTGEMFKVWRDMIIPRMGYALSTGGHPSLDGQYLQWSYPSFEMGYAFHFFEPLFAERHLLAFGPGDAGMTDLVFCPRSTKQAEVEGMLMIGDDSSLARATWHFLVPKDDEHAGGEATFAPLQPAAPPGLLMTVRSEFWRKTSRGRWYQRAWSFGRWEIDTIKARSPAASGDE